jgi:hypothetical protein
VAAGVVVAGVVVVVVTGATVVVGALGGAAVLDPVAEGTDAVEAGMTDGSEVTGGSVVLIAGAVCSRPAHAATTRMRTIQALHRDQRSCIAAR